MTAHLRDLIDGILKGDENDPCLCIIEVIPDEICYWLATRGSVVCKSQNAYSNVETKTNEDYNEG